MSSSTVLRIGTVLSLALYLAATAALGTPPDGSASGQAVVDWFTASGGQVRTWAWLLTLFVPCFATVAALVRSRLPAPHRDVFFVGVVAFLAETSVQIWVWAGLSWHAGQLQPTARTLLDVVSFWGPVLNGVTISMLAPVVLLSFGASAVLPRWLGIVGAVALTEQVIETVTVFGQDGFTAPGGPMNLMLGAGLVSVWVLCLGLTVAARPGAPAGAPAPRVPAG